MGLGMVMPHGPKESTIEALLQWAGRPIAAENDVDWTLKDVPGIS
jgi:hypothetical protein